MNSLQKEALVGLFVILTTGAFVAGSLWLRGKSVGTDDVYVVYPDVATLKDASSVRISGAQVGRVEGIHYVAPGKVVVGLKFVKSYHIHVTNNAKAAVSAVGVLGDYMIVLDPGNGTPLAHGDTIQGTLASGVMDKASQLAEKASQMMTRIDALLDTQLVVDLRHTLESSRKFMTYLSDAHNGPTAQLSPTLIGLQKATQRFDSTLAQMDPRLLQARLDSTMKSAGSAADRLAATSARADSLMARIQRGEGTVGKFMTDTTLFGDLRKAMQSMGDLLAEIKKNPGKIGITVKIL